MKPEQFGPGIWFLMHQWSIQLKKDEYESFISVTKLITNTIPCSSCRYHAQTYLDKNPIEVKEDPLWAFKWWFNFHNKVNKRCEKPIIILNDAIKLYTKSEVCQDCGNDDNEKHQKPKLNNIIGLLNTYL